MDIMNQKEFLKRIKKEYPELYMCASRTHRGSWKTNFGKETEIIKLVKYSDRWTDLFNYDDMYDHIKKFIEENKNVRIQWILDEL